MKKLVLSICILLVGVKAMCQHKYAIIDRRLKTPLQLSDTITKEQMNKGFFAVEKQNIDTLKSKIDVLKKRLSTVAREKYDETKWYIGSTILTIRVVKWTYADRLNVALSTDIGDGHNQSFYIVDSRYTNKDNVIYLNKLLKYIAKANL
jgi:hypothetical protein